MTKRFVKQFAAAAMALFLGLPVGSMPFAHEEEQLLMTEDVILEETEAGSAETEGVTIEELATEELATEEEATEWVSENDYEEFIAECIAKGWNETDARQTAELAEMRGISALQLMMMSSSALLLSGSGESVLLPYTAEEFLAEAVTRLGASYIWGGKGAGYCAVCPSPSKTEVGTHPSCYGNGYDCSGFVYDTMSHFGLTGDGSANVSGSSGLPLSATAWIAGHGNAGHLNLSYAGQNGHMEHLGILSLEQFQEGLSAGCFQPGDVIVEYDGTGTEVSHVFFYFGDFASKEEVVSYLVNKLGVSEEQANAYTIDKGSAWAGGTHWRIEAHGSEMQQGAENGYFVQINNSFEGKGASAFFQVWRQPVTPEEPEPETEAETEPETEPPIETSWLVLEKQDADYPDKKLSGITFEIYSTEIKSEETLVAVVTTKENGVTEAVELPLGTYYIWEKEETVPEGYMLPTQAWAVVLSEKGSSVSVELENRQKPGKISLRKTDGDGKGISGVIFGVYTDETCQNPAFGCVSETDVTLTEEAVQIVTGEDGYGETAQWLKAGRYFVKEISGKEGYWQSNQVYSVQTGNGEIVSLETEVVNERVTGQIRIYKLGEALIDYQNGAFVYDMVPKKGSTFEISAAETIILADQTEPVYQKGEIIETVVSGEDGYAVSKKLPLGMYQVKETTAADGLLIHKGEGEYAKTVILSQPDEYLEVYIEEAEVFENYYSDAKISIYKTDTEGRQYLEGASFGLFTKTDIKTENGSILFAAGSCIETGKTGENGYLHFQSDIPYGEYEIREIEARPGYANTSKTYSISFWGGEQKEYIFEYGFQNVMLTGALKLVKIDAETQSAQKPATLQGAVFGLFAAEDIVHPDGKSGILFAKDSVVTDVFGNSVILITDENGSCEAENLYPGKYYIREQSPSEGYLLNQNTYPVEVVAGNTEETALVSVPESRIKGRLAIRKYSKAEGREDMPVLPGAVFCVYPIASLCYLEDGTPDYENSVRIAVCEDGGTELITDENGEAVSIPLPYGTYLVHEVEAPKEHIRTQDFEVTIDAEQTVKNEAGIPIENKSEPSVWTIVTNQQFTVRLTIEKKDSETKRFITKPAGFKLYSEALGQYLPAGENGTEIFYTNETGSACVKQPLIPGIYWLEEVEAPNGYCCLKQKIRFEVTQGMAVEENEESAFTYCYEKTLMVENIPVKGRIEVYKEGEVLTGFKEDTGFLYEKRPMQGAVFAVIAAEDIIASENSEELFEKNGIIYKKDTEIAFITTNENGIGSIEGLPLGRYWIEERTAPYGLLKSGQRHTAILTWKDQVTRIVTDTDGEENHFVNERPILQLELLKMDEREEQPLADAVFALYNRYDIVDEDGKLLVRAETKLEEVKSDAMGRAVFQCDVPSDIYMPDFKKNKIDSMYYIIEEKAPDGYLGTEELIEDINLIWDRESEEAVWRRTICVTNEALPEDESSVEETTEECTTAEETSEEATEEIIEITTEESTETETNPVPMIPSSPFILGIQDFSGYAGIVLILTGSLLLCVMLIWKIYGRKNM